MIVGYKYVDFEVRVVKGINLFYFVWMVQLFYLINIYFAYFLDDVLLFI